MKGYDQFFAAVKENVSKSLACFEISDEELNDYLKREEEQIEGAYEEYVNKEDAEHLTDDACFAATVASVSMCLEYCY